MAKYVHLSRKWATSQRTMSCSYLPTTARTPEMLFPRLAPTSTTSTTNTVSAAIPRSPQTRPIVLRATSARLPVLYFSRLLAPPSCQSPYPEPQRRCAPLGCLLEWRRAATRRGEVASLDQFTTEQVRNIVLLAHSGAGKTTLAESMLLATKAINRMGRVEDGNTVSDFDPEEHKRQTSLQLAVVPCVWKGTKINVIDTPGYADFDGETVSALSAADGAVLVVSAPSGVEVGAAVAWERLQALGIPTLIFVSKMDREHADYDGTMDELRSQLGSRCAALNLPVGSESSFSGVADLLGDSVPGDLEAASAQARDKLAEAVAETDDDLTLKYLDDGELTTGEIRAGLHAGVVSGAVAPVLAGSALTSGGIEELLDAIVNFLPSPADLPPRKATMGGEEVELTPDPDGPLAALIFKTSADPFVGKLSYFRVLSGTLSANSEVWDTSTGQAERVGQAFVPVGKHQENVPSICAGDIGSVSKLAHAVTGDTLTTKADGVTLPRVVFPEPVYAVAVHPKSKADLDKLSSSLARLVEEDPSLRLTRDQATAEIIVTGMGDTHVDVMRSGRSASSASSWSWRLRASPTARR